jgi:SAM-dependent MidA family methyltransferase
MTSSDRRPPPAERSVELSSVIRAEIGSSPDRRITFARYMDLALNHPDLGYYRSVEDRPTREGDFLTAPETHPLFGWTLARRLEAVWDELDRPARFGLVEYGAGSGTLALTVLDGFRRHGRFDLLEAVEYAPMESNPHRLDDLATRFEKAGLARHLHLPGSDAGGGGTASAGAVPVAGVLIANEFLDALPVHRVLLRGGTLVELYVAERATGPTGRERSLAPGREVNLTRGRGVLLTHVVGELSTPDLAARLADEAVSLAEGQVAEICLGLEPWLAEASAQLERGFVLVLDYGFEAAELYGPRHRAGTLLGYRGHRIVDDPLLDPGSVDLTAHVDLTAVSRLAERHGLRTVGSAGQSEFLLASGLEAEWEAIRTAPDLDAAGYAAARSAVVRLLDPRHLGGFRVVTLAKERVGVGSDTGHGTNVLRE